MTLWEKLKGTILGNAHELADAAIDANQIAVVKQHERDLEAANDEVFAQKAAADAHVSTLQGDIARIEREVEATGHDIDLLLSDDDPSNDDSALTLQQQIAERETELEAKKAELAEAADIARKMGEASDKLASKQRTTLSQVRNLEVLDRQAKAKARATSALSAAGAAVEGVDSNSIDDIASHLREGAAVEEAKFDRAMTGVAGGTAEADVAKARALAALAARKAKLAAAAPPA